MIRVGFLYIILLILVTVASFGWLFIRNHNFDDPYNGDVDISGTLEGMVTSTPPGFISKYAVVKDKEEINAEQFDGSTYAAIMVNNDTRECLVAHNAHERIYPASMTKLMTGIVVCDAIESGELSMDEVVTLDHDISFQESLAVQSSLYKGCKISIRNMLTALMLSSYNDYAIILAERVAGSVDAFAEKMNEKARSIGATNTHFSNPHGLDALDHYTTAFDLYLIVNEASKYEILHEIDEMSDYTYSWEDSTGNTWEDTATATNYFITGSQSLPSNITIGTWKTGTTGGAGNCLTMNVMINEGNYTMMVSDSISKEDLYSKYGIMFNLAN